MSDTTTTEEFAQAKSQHHNRQAKVDQQHR